jgi:adenylosuccinate synthase
MIKVVIGANYGDEGKGLMTDYFVDQFEGNCLVVRHNGGAQAGHTVCTPKGIRHKFSHFGSGTLRGAPTYLSEFFLVNPLLFMKELEELAMKVVIPAIFADGDCLVSTPYDMWVNQQLEDKRGDDRHGSCGVGINETIVRSRHEEFCFRVKDFYGSGWRSKLKAIAIKYFPARCDRLDIAGIKFDHDKFVEVFERFKRNITIADWSCTCGKDLVFEGAQGLLLDQAHPNFPHVTPSNTGFQNVKTLLKQTGRVYDDIEVTYVTRSYMTRHGRGPFPTETNGPPYPGIQDHTNTFNEYQEHLRFGILDLNGLVATIKADMIRNDLERASLAVTCLDQLKHSEHPFVKYFRAGQLCDGNALIQLLRNALQPGSIYQSFGPTRRSITT